ncbi:hypothetical protein Tco_0013144 [Tanacetum coccineum]
MDSFGSTLKSILLNAWTRSNFSKRSVLNEENLVELEYGKVFWARAKELFVWSPSFKDVPEKEFIPYPSGFTPANDIPASNNQDIPEAKSVRPPTFPPFRLFFPGSHLSDQHANLLNINQGVVIDDILLPRLEVLETITTDVQSLTTVIHAKVKIAGNRGGRELPKYFHAIINKKRANLSVKGIMVDGDWIVEPDLVKQEFRRHFTDRFQDPGSRRGSLNFPFPNRLNNDQILELESPISNEDIRTTVWGCGVDKSPGPDGFTFEFFRKYWTVVGPDFCIAVKWFFDHGDFAIGCNSSFVAPHP